MTKKTTQLKELLNSQQLEFILEAHNGLSAKIVEEAGFKGIWASGLSLSASMGVRDNNEASWTQVLEVVEFMSDATNIPILLDGDTGYGNFNNMRRLVKKLEQRGVAGVCIEDKLFPKTNSFIDGEKQPLADVDEFCGKIKAGLDVKNDTDFMIIARTEGFIAGHGVEETLKRAEAYAKAGADAILVHSSRSDAKEIELFMQRWEGRLPIVIVPTKYYSVPTQNYRQMGISLVIWANHMLRSSLKAMQETSRKIYEESSLHSVEREVASVAEIFRLQGAQELSTAENKYLPNRGASANAIVLAASQGELRELTENIPKTLLTINGRTILSNLVGNLNRVGINDISVVRGYKKEKIVGPQFKTIDNDIHFETKDLYSLYLSREQIKDHTIISYGDILYREYVLSELLHDEHDITIVVDATVHPHSEGRGAVSASRPYNKSLLFEPVTLKAMSATIGQAECTGEFMGVWRVKGKGVRLVREALEELGARADFAQLNQGDLFNHLVQKTQVFVMYFNGPWIDVNTLSDYQKAQEIRV